MTSDQQLLAAFAQAHSQDAFRELLLRHQDWVYSVCLRRLPEAGMAEDATQAVFLALAQQAPKLAKKLRPGQLEPWLHQAAKYAAANLRRSHARRQRHEQEAAAMKPEAHLDPAAWQEIESLLEPALDRLSAADRQAILLRYYRQFTHAEIAATLSITEEAAKKRVNRALERLRIHLAKTSIVPSSIAIGPLLLTHAVPPAPAALAAKLAATGSTAAVNSEISLVSRGILQMIRVARLRFAALSTVAVITAAGIPAIPLLLRQYSPQTSEKVAVAPVPSQPTSRPASTQNVSAASSSDRVLAARSISAANLREFVQGANVDFAAKHGGQMPDHLGRLLVNEDISPKSLVMKDSNTQPLAMTPEIIALASSDFVKFSVLVDQHCDYVYLGKGTNTDLDPNIIVAYEKVTANTRDGINLVYQDGHVDFVSLQALPDAFKNTSNYLTLHNLPTVDLHTLAPVTADQTQPSPAPSLP